MQNEIIKLTRVDDLSSRNPPQGVGFPNLGFRKRNEGTQHSEVSSTRNRSPNPHAPNAKIMYKPVEDQEDLDKSLQEHEVTLQEDLDAYGFEDTCFLLPPMLLTSLWPTVWS